MKAPRYLGTFNGHPVWRVDSDAAGYRVWRGRWIPDPDHARPGVLIELHGAMVLAAPPSLGCDADVPRAGNGTLDELCSTPRLARVLRARYVQAHPGAAS